MKLRIIPTLDRKGMPGYCIQKKWLFFWFLHSDWVWEKREGAQIVVDHLENK